MMLPSCAKWGGITNDLPHTLLVYVAMVKAKGNNASADEIKSAQLILENVGGEDISYHNKLGNKVGGVDGIVGSKTSEAMDRFLSGQSPKQVNTGAGGQATIPSLNNKQEYVGYVFAQGEQISQEHRDRMNNILSAAGYDPKNGDEAVKGYFIASNNSSSTANNLKQEPASKVSDRGLSYLKDAEQDIGVSSRIVTSKPEVYPSALFSAPLAAPTQSMVLGLPFSTPLSSNDKPIGALSLWSFAKLSVLPTLPQSLGIALVGISDIKKPVVLEIAGSCAVR